MRLWFCISLNHFRMIIFQFKSFKIWQLPLPGNEHIIQKHTNSHQFRKMWNSYKLPQECESPLIIVPLEKSLLIFLIVSNWRFLFLYCYIPCQLIMTATYLFNRTNAFCFWLWTHFIVGVFNYYLLIFKLIIWHNTRIVYVHVFTLYLYLKKHLHVILHVTSKMIFCNYI